MLNFLKKINRKRKVNRRFKAIQENFIRPLKNDLKENYTIYTNNNLNNEIAKLCELHKSDKGYVNYNLAAPYSEFKPHNYANYYFDLFGDIKNEVKLVFECGIGSLDENVISNMKERGTIPGASLKVWRDYFKNAFIFGADIDKKLCLTKKEYQHSM
mgnify:CR=1 FL=1|jgi:hypothetical protein